MTVDVGAAPDVQVLSASPIPARLTVSTAPLEPDTSEPPVTTTLTPAERFVTRAEVIGAADDEAIQAQVPAWIRWGRNTQWLNPTDDTIPPCLNPTWEAASLSVYPASESTKVMWVWASATGAYGSAAPIDEPSRWLGIPTGQFPLFSVPTANGWKGANGTTDQAYFVEYGPDHHWMLQGLRRANWWDRLLLSFRPGIPRQPRDGDWVCDKGGLITPDNAWKIVTRGMGNVPWLTGIVRPAEVAAARADGHRGIGHLLTATSMALETGPLAHFLSPATRVEIAHENNGMLSSHPNAPDPRLVMQGLVLASTLTEAEIDDRLEVLIPTDLSWRRTVKVWWMTLSEHGIVIGAVTGRGDTAIETSTMAPGYRESSAWAALGHTSQERNRSVFKNYPWETLYAVAPSPVPGIQPAA